MKNQRVFLGLIAFLILLILGDFVVTHKPHFEFDAIFAFAPLLGFAAVLCLAFIGWMISEVLITTKDRS